MAKQPRPRIYPPRSISIGSFEDRLNDYSTCYSLLVQSKWGVQEVLFDKDLLEIVKSANSVRIFDSNAGRRRYALKSGKPRTTPPKLYAQLLWKQPGEPIRCLYLHRIAMGVETAGRGIHVHHLSTAVSTLDCRRSVLEVLTASEHAKLRKARRAA